MQLLGRTECKATIGLSWKSTSRASTAKIEALGAAEVTRMRESKGQWSRSETRGGLFDAAAGWKGLASALSS